MSLDSRNRVLIIGLDGATWDLLDPWAAQGLLPTIERLRSRGAWGPLRTTIPPITPSAWNSLYTGTNPGKHGIFGFSRRRADGYRLAPIHSSARKVKTVFQILSDAGLQVGVLNAPATYPPEPLNGLFVPGIPVPDGSTDYTQPPEFAAELDALTRGRHRFPPAAEEATGDAEAFFRHCDEYIRAVTSAATLMMDRLGDWDFFMVQFQVTDAVQHAFWHCLDPDHPRHDPDAPESIRDAVLNRYRLVDQCLNEILDGAGEQADILVVSDHGGAPLYGQLYINIWLWQRGWLKFRRSPVTLFRRLLYALGFTPEFLRRQVYARSPGGIRRLVHARKGTVLALADRLFLSLDDVDWERTRAYSFGGPFGAIYVNLEGREPRGCVPEDQYESVLTQLEGELREIRHPLTGDSLIEDVLCSSDLYQGPSSNRGPDLQMVSPGLSNMGFLQFQSKRWIGPPWNRWSGHHSMDGMLLVAGPHARNRVQVDGAGIMDIAPTSLALLGQPIPDWMDGQVIASALSADFLEQSPPRVVHDDAAPGSVATAGAYSAEEEAQIAKRLADLGYIE